MSGLRIHYFQHLVHEDLGSIENWVEARGHHTTCTKFFEANPALPALADIDWLIVMGGAMGVYDHDKFPWLQDEWAYIRDAIDAGKTVLGICLGSQLIAHALGSKVFPGPAKEIGWLPVTKTAAGKVSPLFEVMPDPFTVFQWHGDTFDLPPGATLLASSSAVAHQAFSYGDRVLALQFHLEATERGVTDFLREDGDSGEIAVGGTWVQSKDVIRSGMHNADITNRVMTALLDRLAAVGATVT
jgi:GMP synthase (glutamine-hydrolysing)